MSEPLRFRVGDLVGVEPPCEQLSAAEVEDLADGRLSLDRLEQVRKHAETCASCAELLDDVDRFGRLVTSGLTIPSERRAFERTDPEVRRGLGLAGPSGWHPWTRLPRRIQLWALPSFAAVVLLLVWLWPSRPLLIADLDPVPLVPPPSVRGLSLGETWDRLQGSWGAGDMSTAARILESAIRDHPERADLRFYLGVALLRSGDAPGAVDALRDADRLEDPIPSEHTRWMLAAALERTNRVSEACEALRSVAEIGGTRASAAREIVARACGNRP